MMAEFGFIAAVALGAAAGTTDLTDGMFRHLVITGRSRLALYLARIPAGLAITIPLVALAFVMNCLVTSYQSPPPPTSVSLAGRTVPEHLDQAGLQTWLRQHPQQAASGMLLGPTTPAQVRQAIDKNIAPIYRAYLADETSGLNPADNEMAKIGLWLELEVGIGFLVGLGLGSLTGQRTTTTIVLIALEIIVTPLLARTQIPYFIDGQRLVIGVAMDQLRPAGLASPVSGGGPGQVLFGGRGSSRHSADADLGDDLGDRRLDRRLVGPRRMADDHPRRLTQRRSQHMDTGMVHAIAPGAVLDVVLMTHNAASSIAGLAAALQAGPPGVDDHVVGEAGVDGVMQAEADDAVIVRVERLGGVFAEHGAEGIDERLPETGPVAARPGRQRDVQPDRARIDRGRPHREPIMELLFPLPAHIGPSHPDRELRAGPGRGWLG